MNRDSMHLIRLDVSEVLAAFQVRNICMCVRITLLFAFIIWGPRGCNFVDLNKMARIKSNYFFSYLFHWESHHTQEIVDMCRNMQQSLRFLLTYLLLTICVIRQA